MIRLYPVGFHVTLHVTVPTIHSILHGAQCHTVHHPVVYSGIGRSGGRILQTDALRPFGQQIVAEAVMPFQVPVQFLQYLLLPQRFLFLSVCTFFPIPAFHTLYRKVILPLPACFLFLQGFRYRLRFFHPLYLPLQRFQTKPPTLRVLSFRLPFQPDTEFTVTRRDRCLPARQFGTPSLQVHEHLPERPVHSSVFFRTDSFTLHFFTAKKLFQVTDQVFHTSSFTGGSSATGGTSDYLPEIRPAFHVQRYYLRQPLSSL